MDAYLRGGGFFPRLKYAHSYWQKKFENEKYSSRYKGNFGEIISWRLISLFNLMFAEKDLKKQEFLEFINFKYKVKDCDMKVRELSDTTIFF